MKTEKKQGTVERKRRMREGRNTEAATLGATKGKPTRTVEAEKTERNVARDIRKMINIDLQVHGTLVMNQRREEGVVPYL